MTLLSTVSFLLYVFAWATPCLSVPTDDGVRTAGDEALALARSNLGKSEHETVSPSFFSSSSEKEPAVGGVFRAAESGCKSCHLAGYTGHEAAGSRSTRSTEDCPAGCSCQTSTEKLDFLSVAGNPGDKFEYEFRTLTQIGGEKTYKNTAFYLRGAEDNPRNELIYTRGSKSGNVTLGEDHTGLYVYVYPYSDKGCEERDACQWYNGAWDFKACLLTLTAEIVPVNKPQLGRILGIDLQAPWDSTTRLPWDSCSGVDCHVSPDVVIGGQHYETAIYAPAPSVIEFNLADGFDRLHTCFGVCCYGFGTVNFRVTGDNKVLLDWQKKNYGEVATCIDIDLKGVTTLKLESNDAGDRSGHDFASWGNSYVYNDGIQCYGEPSTSRQLECANGKMGYETDRWNGCVDQGSVRVRCPKGHYPCNALRDNGKEFVCGTTCENQGGKRECKLKELVCFAEPSTTRQLECANGKLGYATDRWNGCVDQGSVRVRCPKGHYPCNELRDNLKEFICGTTCENFGGKRTCSSTGY